MCYKIFILLFIPPNQKTSDGFMLYFVMMKPDPPNSQQIFWNKPFFVKIIKYLKAFIKPT